MFHYPGGTPVYYLAFTLTLVVVAAGSGTVSIYLQRRRIPAVIGSVVAGLALLALALNVLFAIWWLTLVAAAGLGAGLGLYLACDLALVTLVVPSSEQEQHGRTIGIMNTIISPMMACQRKGIGLILTI